MIVACCLLPTFTVPTHRRTFRNASWRTRWTASAPIWWANSSRSAADHSTSTASIRLISPTCQRYARAHARSWKVSSALGGERGRAGALMAVFCGTAFLHSRALQQFLEGGLQHEHPLAEADCRKLPGPGRGESRAAADPQNPSDLVDG